MNVVQVTPFLSRLGGGMFESVKHLSKTLYESRRAALTVIGLKDERTNEDAAEWSPVSVQAYESIGPSQFGFSPALRRYLATANLDLVHLHGLWKYLSIAVHSWGRRTDRPYVISSRGMLEPWALKQSSLQKKIALWSFQRMALQSAACLHATSRQEARSIRLLGFENPIAVIPNGVLIPGIPERTIDRSRIRHALFLSRLHPKKGLLNLLNAWHAVRPDGWRLLIAGPDEKNHLQEVKAVVRQLALEDEITFFGDVRGELKAGLYSRADLFVLPSHSENFGLVIAEALSFGVPVITTRATPWEDLEKRNCGWWIDVGLAPLVQALREAISAPIENLLEMGLRGRKLVEEKYGWDKVAQQMLEIYEWLIRKGEQPSWLEQGVAPTCASRLSIFR